MRVARNHVQRRVANLFLAAACTAVLLHSQQVRAANYTWTGINNATWNTTGTNWTPAGATWSANTHTAVFDSAQGNSGGTVLVSSTVSTAGLFVNSGNYTLAGGGISLAQNNVVNIGSGTLTFGTVTSALNLQNVQRFNGNFVLANGTFTTASYFGIGHGDGGGTPGGTFTQTGGVVNAARGNGTLTFVVGRTTSGTSIYNLDGGSVNLTGGAIIGFLNSGTATSTLNITGGTMTFVQSSATNANILSIGWTTGSGTATLNMSGGEIRGMQLSTKNASTDNGRFLFSGGILRPSSGGNLVIGNSTNSALSVPITLTGTGGIVNSTDSGTSAPTARQVDIYSNIREDATGGRGITYDGAGLTVLYGTNSYTGRTLLLGGTVRAASSTAFGTGGNITFSGATLQYTGSSNGQDWSSRIKNSGSAISVDTNSQNVAFAGVIDSSNTGGLVKSGSGTLTLSGANTYSGQTRVSAGVLALGASNAISNQSNLLVDGGGFNLAGFSDTVGTVTITSGSIFGSGTLGGSSYAFGGGTVAANLGSGTLTVTGPSTLAGTSDATSLNLNSGALTLGSGSRFRSSTIAVTGSSGGSLTLGGNELFGSLAGAADISLGANTLSVGGANTSTIYSGSLSGSGVLSKLGSGTFTLSGNNSHSGGTQIAAGTLRLGSSAALPTSSAVTLGTGSTSAALDFNTNTATLASITFNGSGSQLSPGGKLNLLASGTANATITVNSGSQALHPDTTLQSNTVINLAAGSYFSLHGVIDGSKSLTQIGSGTLAIFGANSNYTGNTYLSGGYMSVQNTGALGSGTVTIDGNSILNLNNTILNNTIVFGSGSGAIINSGTLVNVTGTYSITSGTGSSITTNYNVQSGGNISFVDSLASTVYVQGTAVGTFSSDVLSAGTVIVNTGGRGTFSGGVAGNVTTSGSSLFSGSVLGNVTVNGGTATFAGATGTSSAINVNSGLGVVTGTVGSIAHATAAGATLEIRGRVLATADVNAEAGSTVKLMGSQAFDGTTIENNGSVIVDRSANLALAAVISGSGSLTKSDALTLTLTGNNTFTGLTTISGGTLSIGNGGASGALAGNVLNNAAMTFNRSDDTTYAGSVSGSGNLTKLGSGTLTLTGSNSYAGTTTVSNGVLAVNGRIASSVAVATGATLGGSGLISGNIGGDGLIAPGNSPGILTVTGQLDATSSTSFAFELSQTGAPVWSNASNSLNDLLRLTATSPFTTPLAATNVVNVYFDVTSLANGDTFLGGFFVDNPSNAANLLADGLGSSVFQYFVRGDGQGGYAYNNASYYSFDQYMATHAGITGVTRAVVPVASANFSDATITTGQVTQFVIVPEPSNWILSGVGVAITGWSMWMRRRRAQILYRLGP